MNTINKQFKTDEEFMAACDVALKPLQAQLNMREFDPTKELHYTLLVVKQVDPGCTAELQIEDSQTGEVTRITTTEDPSGDQRAFEQALLTAFRKAWFRK